MIDSDDYPALVIRAIKFGWPIPAPQTRDDLEWLATEYPERALPFLPSGDELAKLGISRNVGRDIAPIALEWCERFLVTLDSDSEFADAVRQRMGGQRA